MRFACTACNSGSLFVGSLVLCFLLALHQRCDGLLESGLRLQITEGFLLPRTLLLLFDFVRVVEVMIGVHCATAHLVLKESAHGISTRRAGYQLLLRLEEVAV